MELEFDTGYNPCGIMSLEEGVQLVALTEMIIYLAAILGTGILTISTDPGPLYLAEFLIYLIVGFTFPLLFMGSRKRNWKFCLPSAAGLCFALLGRIGVIGGWPTNGVAILSGLLSLSEIYFFVIIVAYIVDVRNRPEGAPKIPELFSEPLDPDADSPYIEQILSTDASAASVRKNPRFQNGFP